jgi:BirA family biotin operon repressor/biotin-[acetyl-CoA-carboxylase] ligase
MTCIVANEQTAGRGTFKKRWVSPPGVNIYATFHFQLPRDDPRIPTLAILMAKSLATVLTKEGLSPVIKWPNDLLLNGKKLSGVLCETEFHEDVVELFLGVGINVNLERQETEQIDQPATSLLIETGRNWDREELLEKLQRQFLLDLFSVG